MKLARKHRDAWRAIGGHRFNGEELELLRTGAHDSAMAFRKAIRDLAIEAGAIGRDHVWTEEELTIMESMQLQAFMEEAWKALPDKDKQQLGDRMRIYLMKCLHGDFGKTLVTPYLEDMLSAELEERRPEIRERVKREVVARFDAEIESVVKAQVDRALAKLRAEIVGGR